MTSPARDCVTAIFPIGNCVPISIELKMKCFRDGLMKQANISDDNQRPKLLPALGNIIFLCIATSLWFPLSAACLPVFLMGLLVWGLPPTIPVWSRTCKYFTAVFTEGKSEDNIPLTNRVITFMLVLNVVVKIPVNGVCWFLDEFLYPDYHKKEIKEPVFFITAPRSGSTQLCQYLEDDKENFIVPTVAEAMMPYIWFWKLLIPTLARFGIKQQHFEVSNPVGMEAKKRHEFYFSKTDTWDGLVGVWHMNIFSWCLGFSFFKWGYSYAKLEELIDEDFYNSNFLFVTNHVMRKVMYLHGSPKQHVLLKGHFLLAAESLKRQYPKAKFFAVIRQPLERLPSNINLLRVMSVDGPHAKVYGLFPPSWKVIRDYVISTQIPYCKQEMSFYKDDQENKLVIPFTMYVNNLSATMRTIYSFCNIPIPDHVVSRAIKLQNTSHDRSKLKVNYHPDFNRSLTSLGVDEDKVKEDLAEYIEWVNQLENCKKYN